MAVNNNITMSNGSILQFPTEIFHFIFDYLDCQTIIQSIGLVCNQLQNIVDSYNRLKLDFSRLSDQQLKSLSQLVQTKNVLSISLSDDDKGELSHVESLFSLFNFDQFIHLKSLRLTQIDDEQFFKKILQYRLKSLSVIYPYQTKNEIERKMNLISSMIVPCELEELNLNLSNDIWINSSESTSIESILRHLTISNCTGESYGHILSSCKNLKTLTMKSFSFETTTLSSCVSSSLTSLMLDGYLKSMQQLFDILSSTPFLLHLRIKIWGFQSSEMICGQLLETFLHSHLCHLEQIHFSIMCRQSDCSLQSIIQSFQTPFWLNDKHQIIHCDYVFRPSEIVLYTASLKINTNVDVIRCTNFSSNDDQFQLILPDRSSSSSDEQVRQLFETRFSDWILFSILLNVHWILVDDTGVPYLIEMLNKNIVNIDLFNRLFSWLFWIDVDHIDMWK